ncbi:MAG: FAD-dependent monooxygenase [Methylophilaceae bacterium]
MQKKQSLVIIGGGPVGLVLALTMQQSGLSFTVLEARKKGEAYHDKRALALSYGSKMILESLGVWHAIAPNATAINTIHVSQTGGLGRTKLCAEEHDLPALGYVVSYGTLMQVLNEQINMADILYEAVASAIRQDELSAEVDYVYEGEQQRLKTALVVIAEGGRSLEDIPGIERRTKAYGHDALVSMVACELPHNHVAYERFTPSGPMALLPNGEKDFSLVWTGEKASIQRLLEMEEETFLEALHLAFGDRVGRFLSIGKRLSFPLVKSELKPKVTSHLVVVGNSAQTMHPVAGQGFNVGLRDATSLAKVLSNTPALEWGSEAMLKSYASTRVRDTKGGLLFTDFLVNLFSNDLLGLTSMRGLGLGLLDVLPPAKQMLVSKMSYGK